MSDATTSLGATEESSAVNGPGASPANRHGRLWPEPDVLEAIELAVVELWPNESEGSGRPTAPTAYPWRFSGRTWAGPAPLRRSRPGR